MQLIYRGITYDRSFYELFSQLKQLGEHLKSACELSYRGIPYRVDPIVQSERVAVSVESHQLTYRGVNYFASRSAQGEITVPPQSVKSTRINLEKTAPDALLPVGGKS
ncbi:DUF4278 domain-containing protein [Pseudanabaena sp. PCC 6802]|uniref:DUF4278 domain-containing protein n=1 Tax=Pseudanabaena sp. PCC 6802 TaxID=118173 RepID=UPI000349007E|nr:DUF4278 domain-containing protein [Pseudanabaena sp. PCC 6802]